MTRRLAWVIGAGGLLGSALTRQLANDPNWELWQGPRNPWTEPDRLRDVWAQEIARFCDDVRGRPWAIFWSAGVGTVGTSGEAMARETETLRLFLKILGDARPGERGFLFLASSAGGVYGAQSALPITETHSPAPVSEYGAQKLKQEDALRTWLRDHPAVSGLIGRISNLYGPDQNLAKSQGLISHLSTSLIRRQPVHIFVPLDTIRDYLFAPDCAADILRCATLAETGCVTKIFASESGSSVSQVIGCFTKIGRQKLKVLYGLKPEGRLQPLILSYRSEQWPGAPKRTPLVEGIHITHERNIGRYQAGRL